MTEKRAEKWKWTWRQKRNRKKPNDLLMMIGNNGCGWTISPNFNFQLARRSETQIVENVLKSNYRLWWKWWNWFMCKFIGNTVLWSNLLRQDSLVFWCLYLGCYLKTYIHNEWSIWTLKHNKTQHFGFSQFSRKPTLSSFPQSITTYSYHWESEHFWRMTKSKQNS